MQALYTAIAHASGEGRGGRVASDDGRINLDTRVPREMGGSGEGTNPEQLFAAGYAASFLSAVHGVARMLDADTSGAQVSASVSIGKIHSSDFGLGVQLHIYLPNVDVLRRPIVVDAAHRMCPYSNATRGNIAVGINLVT